MPAVLSKEDYKAYEVALVRLHPLSTDECLLISSTCTPKALRLLKTVKPGESVRDALTLFQTRIVLEQAGLPYTSSQETTLRLQEELRVSVSRTEQKELEMQLLKAQLEKERASFSTEAAETIQSVTVKGKKDGKKPAEVEVPESQQPKKRKKKKAGQGTKEATPDPPLLSLDSLSGIQKFGLAKVKDILQTEEWAKLDPSLNILSSLRELQHLPRYVPGSYVAGYLNVHVQTLDLEQRHISHIFETLHSSMVRLLKPSQGQGGGRSVKRNDDFRCLASLYLATLDTSARILDHHVSLSERESGKEGREEVLKGICIHMGELVNLLLPSLSSQSKQLYYDILRTSPVGSEKGRTAQSSAQTSRASSDSAITTPPPRQGCRTEISEFLFLLCTLSEHRPASPSFGMLQPALIRYIQYANLQEIQCILGDSLKDPESGLPSNRQSRLDYLLDIAAAREGLAAICEVLSATTTAASANATEDWKELSFDLVKQAEQQTLLQILSYILEHEEAIARFFGEEMQEILMGVVHEVGMAAGPDAIDGLLDVLQGCCMYD